MKGETFGECFQFYKNPSGWTVERGQNHGEVVEVRKVLGFWVWLGGGAERISSKSRCGAERGRR